MSDSGIAALDAMIAKMKALGDKDAVAKRVTTKAAPAVDAALKKTIKAGTNPEGAAWAPTKKGKRPMVNAASHVTTQAAGNYVIARLQGPDVYHHIGARGEPVRQVIPDAGTMPPAVEKALVQAAKEVFEEITK